MVPRIAFILLASFVFLGRVDAQTPAKPRTDLFGDPLPEGAIARLGTERLRPGRPTVAIAFSPDGKKLASAHGDSFVDIWDTATGLRHARLSSAIGVWIHCVTFSPDGKYLAAASSEWHSASGSYHSVIWLWSLANADQPAQPRILAEKIAHVSGHHQLVFSPDSKTLLSAIEEFNPAASWETIVKFWNPINGELTASFEHPGHLTAATFLSQGRQLVTFGSGSKLRVWDVATFKMTRQLEIEGGPGPVRRVPDDVCVQVVAQKEGKHFIETWNMTTLKRMDRIEDSFVFNPKLTAANYHYPLAAALLEHLPNLEAVKTHLLEKTGEIYALAASADGGRVAVATQTRLFLWDAKTGKDLLLLNGHDAGVRFSRFLLDNTTLVTASADGKVRSWNATNGKLLNQFEVPTARRAEAIDICVATKTLVVPRSLDDWEAGLGVELWNVADGKKGVSWTVGRSRKPLKDSKDLNKLDRADYYDYWVDQFSNNLRTAISPDGKTLAVITSANMTSQWEPRLRYKVLVVDVATGKPKREFGQFPGNSPAIMFSPDGKFLAIYDDDHYDQETVPGGKFGDARLVRRGGQRMWDTLTWKEVEVARYYKEPALFFLPGGQLLGTETYPWRDQRGIASFDVAKKEWKLWLRAVPTVSFLAVHPGIQAVLLRPNWRGPAPVCIRDLATGKLLGRMPGHQCRVNAGAMSPDGMLIATACEDGTVLIWDIAAVMKRQRDTYAPLADAKLKSLWNKLGNQPDNDIDDTIDALVAASNALTFLQGKLKPVSTEQLKRCLADLDSNSFAVREKATAELSRMEFAAKKALQDLLAAPPSLEVSQRVKKLLADLEPKASPRLQASWRALAALEQIDTPQARKLLEALAKGAPEASLTREAQAVVQRFVSRQD